MAKILRRWELVCISSVVVLVLTGCATVKSDWQKAQEQNSIAAYEDFVIRHPDSQFSPEARLKIEQIAWERTLTRNSAKAYEGFLRAYPNSGFVEEAKMRKNQLINAKWEEIKQTDNAEAYRRFIAEYSDSEFSAVARRKLDQMEEAAWRDTRQQNTPDAYIEFLQQYPSSSFASIAKEELKRSIEPAFQKASRDLSSLRLFVQMYPIYTMPISFQQNVEDTFADILLSSSDLAKQFAISAFSNAARKSIPAREKGSVTISPAGSLVRFHLEYPKDRQPFASGGAYLPMGHGSIWRFKGSVTNIMGFDFEGKQNDPLRFILVDGYGLMYLYGTGKVVLKDGSTVSLP